MTSVFESRRAPVRRYDTRALSRWNVALLSRGYVHGGMLPTVEFPHVNVVVVVVLVITLVIVRVLVTAMLVDRDVVVVRAPSSWTWSSPGSSAST